MRGRAPRHNRKSLARAAVREPSMVLDCSSSIKRRQTRESNRQTPAWQRLPARAVAPERTLPFAPEAAGRSMCRRSCFMMVKR